MHPLIPRVRAVLCVGSAGLVLALAASGQSLSTGAPRQVQAARRLHVLGLTAQWQPQAEAGPALRLAAKVAAIGLAGQPIRMTVRLRTTAGAALGAVPGAPPQFGTAQELAVTTLPDQIRFATAEWQPHVLIPAAVLALPAGMGPQLVASAQVQAQDLTSTAELTTALPGGDPPAPSAALRLVNFGHFHDQPEPLRAPGPDVAGVGGVRTVAVRFGCVACATLEADGLLDQRLELQVRLRRPEGDWVRATQDGGAPAAGDDQGRFVARAGEAIRFANARWDALCAFLPYAALDLAPGQEHRLILNLQAAAGGLVAAAEEEFVLRTAAAPEPTPVPVPDPVPEPVSSRPAAPAAGPLELPPNFLDLVPGRTTRAAVHARLGRPGAEGQPGTLLPAARDLRLTRLELTYDDQGVVQAARIATARQLTPDVAALLFSLADRPERIPGDAFAPADTTGATVSYCADGVHFRVVGDVVTVLWLTLPGAKAGAVPWERPELFVPAPAGPR